MNQNIFTKNCIKYLGVELDSKLLFNTAAQNRFNKTKAVANKLRPLLTSEHLPLPRKIQLYKACIVGTLSYAIDVWGPLTAQTTINKLQSYQNRWLRLLVGGDIRYDSDTYHQLTNIAKIKDLIMNRVLNSKNKLSKHSNPLLNTLKNKTNRSKNDKINLLPFEIYNPNM